MSARDVLRSAGRILVKLDSSIVTRSTGTGLALGRTANIVEQVSHLTACGREVILVTGGSTAIGRQVFCSSSPDHVFDGELPIPTWKELRMPLMSKTKYKTEHHDMHTDATNRLCAAAGQAALMSLYESMFNVYNISCAQILVSIPDLEYASPREQTCDMITGLMSRGVVPIVNENDAVAFEPADGDTSVAIDIVDNDGISAVLARQLECDAMLLLSNDSSDGLSTPKPTFDKIEIVSHDAFDSIEFHGQNSHRETGSVKAKVEAAIYAAEGGVSTVIADGVRNRSILEIIAGKDVGTCFFPRGL